MSIPARFPATLESVPRRRTGWRWIGAGILLAAGAIAVYAALWPDAPFRDTDTTEYLQAARAIATGHLEVYQPRTPGLPLFTLLAGTGRAFFLLSLALHMTAVGLLAAVLRGMRVSGRLTALFAAAAVLPSFVQKDAYVLTEGLFEFLTAAGFAALWGRRLSPTRLMLGGTAFALAALTRPQGQLLPFVFAALLLFYYGRREGLRRAAYLLAPFCLLVGSVMVNNLVRYGNPNLTYDLGFHVGTRTVTLFEDIPDPQVRRVMVETRNAAYGDPNRNPIWTSLYTRPELMKLTGKTAPELAGYMLQIHLHLILGHPLAYLEEVGRATIHFWLPDLSKRTNRRAAVRVVSTATQLTLSALFLALAVLWTGLGMARRLLPPAPAWLADTPQRFLFTAGMATVAYTEALCTALDMGEARYRSTVELVMLFLLVAAADFLGKRRRAAG